ncbi:MAG: hypothetical protein HYV07_23960 [Deltaproteobacteria bacterium]|nr:hypothetical protein [Deltaproteobacteria bacterium]
MNVCAICGAPARPNQTFCDACQRRLDASSEDDSATLRDDDDILADDFPEPTSEVIDEEPSDVSAAFDPAELVSPVGLPIDEEPSPAAKTIVWNPSTALFSGEAVILGDPDVPEVATIEEPEGERRGSSLSGFAFADAAMLSRVGPSAVPRLVQTSAAELSPFEQFLVRRIDGRRTVKELGASGALSSEELSVGLLSLLERGMLEIDPADPSPRESEQPARTLRSPDSSRDAVELVRKESVTADVFADEIIDSADVELESDEVDEDELATLPEGAALPRMASSAEERPGSDAADRIRESTSRSLRGAPAVPPVDDLRTPVPRLPSRFFSPAVEPRPPSVMPRDLPPPRLPSMFLVEVEAPESTRTPSIGEKRDARELRLERRKRRWAGREGMRKQRARMLAAISERELADSNIVGARLSLRIARALDPEDASLSKLLESAQRVQTVSTNDPELRNEFEEALRAEEKGRLDTAIALLEKALEKRRDAVVLNRLGVILSTRRRNLRRARDLLEEAARLAPENPTYAHNLSKIERMLAPRAQPPARPPPPQGLLRRIFGRSGS